ncbi:MAG: oligosaccharide flippase family protein [Candidatus Rokubacteria bacterium]|nr:oligosaccharide flippase family protein [Candidatus Rokubacteria bacterium]
MSRVPGTAERVARNALLKAAVQATRLLSLGFVILAARVLGPEGFGKFTFAYALATLLGATLDLGMHAILVRSVARARAETAAYWAAAATLKLTLLLPVGVIFVALPLVTQRPFDTAVAVWLLGGAIALQSFLELAVCVFTGFERLEVELGVRLVEKVLLFGVGVAGLLLGGRLLLVAGSFTLAGAAALALGVGLVHRRFARLRWRWDPAGARALGRALGPVAVAFLLAFATTRLIPLLVALLAGDVAAGYFGAAVRVLDVVMVVPVIVVAAVYPVLARTAAMEPEFRRLVVHAVGLLLMLGLPVAVAFYHGAGWLTAWVYGSRYAEAAPVLAWLGAAACLGFLREFLGFVLLALDRPRRLVAVAATSLGASLALTPGLVLALGALGGAVALVLVELVALTGDLVGLAPFIRLPFDRGALKAGAAALGAIAIAGALPSGSGGRMGTALVVYTLGLLVLQPVPVALWGRLLRGAVGGGELPPGPR